MTTNAKRCIGFFVVIGQLSLAGCAATTPSNTDFDSDINFSEYQSFAWLSENPMKVAKVAVAPRATLEPSVMMAIRSQLEASGFVFSADSATADFLLSFTVGSRAEIDRESYPATSSSPGGRGGWATAYYPGGTGAAYTQGVLAIDVFDADELRPVWHGVYGKKIREDDREEMDVIVAEAVASILSKFPPQ
jgi:hypothetical protein